MFSLAASSAFAAPTNIQLQVTDLTNGGTSGVVSGTDSIAFGSTEVGKFQVSVDSTRDDGVGSPGVATLHTTTIDIDNHGTVTSTIDIKVTGLHYTVGDTGGLTLTCSISGTSSVGLAGQVATGQTWIDTTDTPFGMPASGTGGVLTGHLHATAPPASTYDFNGSPPGSCPPVSVLGVGLYSITQEIQITLAPGKQGSITFDSVVTTPEPSSMALAGIGALCMIGYGIRRRRGA
jgi:hypothetical protein